jgi:hypothetical protein
VQVVSGSALPAGYEAVAADGTFTFTVPSGPYSGTVKVVLVDTSTCGPNVYCASLPATITISVT